MQTIDYHTLPLKRPPVLIATINLDYIGGGQLFEHAALNVEAPT